MPEMSMPMTNAKRIVMREMAITNAERMYALNGRPLAGRQDYRGVRRHNGHADLLQERIDGAAGY